MKWSDISKNPDDPRVVAFRRNLLVRTRSRDLNSLTDLISESTSGSSIVVDVGYANHDPATGSTSGDWAHNRVRKLSPPKAEIIGLDPVHFEDCDSRCRHFSLESEIIQAIQRLRDPGKVTVLALNVIEHVDNATEFLKSLARVASTSNDSEIWISTPNPAWIGHLYDWMNNTNTSVNVDHVALFGASELAELASRAQLNVKSWGYLGRGDMPPTSDLDLDFKGFFGFFISRLQGC